VNRAERRAAAHGRRSRHRPYEARPITYHAEVALPTVASWNDGEWSTVRIAYGEAECPDDLRPVIVLTKPASAAFVDHGVVAVAHYEAQTNSHQMVHELVHEAWAMMDEKHGRHWRPGDVFILAVPATGEPECLPDFQCDEHHVCVSCGDTIHLGPPQLSGGFVPPMGTEAASQLLTDMIVGNPPRCAACRGLDVP